MDPNCHGPEPTGCFISSWELLAGCANDGQTLLEEGEVSNISLNGDDLVILLLLRKQLEQR